eukprot:2232155-Amphidinium_carterae.4
MTVHLTSLDGTLRIWVLSAPPAAALQHELTSATMSFWMKRYCIGCRFGCSGKACPKPSRYPFYIVKKVVRKGSDRSIVVSKGYKHLRRCTNQVLVELFTGMCADVGRPMLALIASKDPEGLSKILYTASYSEPCHGIGPRGIADWKQAYERRIMDCGNILEILPHAVKDGMVTLHPLLGGVSSDEEAMNHKYTIVYAAPTSR